MRPRPQFAKWLSDTNDVTKTFLSAGQIPNLINLGGGLPDPSTWPVAELAELAALSVTETTQAALSYSPIEGLSELRDLVSKRYSTPDLRLTRTNVLITSGGMQALSLVGNVLLEDCGAIAAQSPAYLGALDAWRPRRPIYRPMHLDDPDFDPTASFTGAQFAYTVPNFSNPTGRLVGIDQRRQLLEASETTGTWLVEDDPYGTLHYDGPRQRNILNLVAPKASPYAGPVIYLGTMSKELVPGLRVGWVIASPEMIQSMVIAKQGSDLCTSGLSQCIALRALSSGLIDRTLPRTISLYRSRRDALCKALSDHLSDFFTWEVPAGGMFVWAIARDRRLNTDKLLHIALSHGVCIAPSSAFDPQGKNRSAIRINFTLNDEDRLNIGVQRLARATKATLKEPSAI
jgi:2-aminoadipate transaminase